MTAISHQNQAFTQAERLSLLTNEHSPLSVVRPAQRLRQIILKHYAK
jgi:hypothetical protein